MTPHPLFNTAHGRQFATQIHELQDLLTGGPGRLALPQPTSEGPLMMARREIRKAESQLRICEGRRLFPSLRPLPPSRPLPPLPHLPSQPSTLEWWKQPGAEFSVLGAIHLLKRLSDSLPRTDEYHGHLTLARNAITMAKACLGKCLLLHRGQWK
jgi:hypothetical protein